jgi:hypothetical protein
VLLTLLAGAAAEAVQVRGNAAAAEALHDLPPEVYEHEWECGTRSLSAEEFFGLAFLSDGPLVFLWLRALLSLYAF